jgi:hypothetical protein
VHAMKVSTKKARKMAMASLSGLTAPHTRANLLITTFTELVCTHGLINVNTMESG